MQIRIVWETSLDKQKVYIHLVVLTAGADDASCRYSYYAI